MSRKTTTYKPLHIYNTHDNGSKVFSVYVYKDRVDVYKLIYNNNTDSYDLGKKIKSFEYNKIFVGDNILNLKLYAKKGTGKGNTILLKNNDTKYAFIGSSIKEITIKDNLKKYVSPIGNSDFPYPYIIGSEYTYLIIENKYIPNNILNLKKCPYEQYYKNNDIMNASKPMKVKTLVKHIL